jgi:SAM-dependent methyltransferase
MTMLTPQQAMSTPCPICRSQPRTPFFVLENMPVSIGVQWPTTSAALQCARGDLRLAFCPDCGLVWNQAFEPERMEYSQAYDNALEFSPVFQTYARGLARRLIDTYDLREKEIVEIGCGKGHFLTLLCEEGSNRGIGFDPSYEGSRVASATPERITYVPDYYGEAQAVHGGDLICCRHVFEHIPDPAGFLTMVRRTLGNRRSAVVYFEVPNVRFILDRLSVWDVIYEHCNYFSTEALARVFQRCGFEIIRLGEDYDGQFLSVEARAAEPGGSLARPAGDLTELANAVERFRQSVHSHAEKWRSRLRQFERSGFRVAAWGGGSKAVSFFNMLKIGDTIPYVVDINPHKQGKHLPGTGQPLVAPEFLQEFRPDIVVLMNPIYHDEVQAHLRKLGVSATILPA